MFTAMSTMPALSLAALGLLFVLNPIGAAKLPSSWATCSKSDPKLNDCLRTAIQKAISELKTGYPKMGLFSIDPFKIEKLHMEQGTGNVRISMEFADLYLRGLSTAHVNSVRAKLDERHMHSELVVPELKLESTYDVKGQILVVPVNGRGRCNITLEECKISFDFTGSPMEGKNGKSYWNIDHYKVLISPKQTRFRFVNKDHPNSQQVQILNRFVNDNNEEVMKELQPAISDAFSEAFKTMTTRVFSRVPTDEIFH